MTSPYLPKKFCRFCRGGEAAIDWKNPHLLRSFVRYHGRIVPRRTSGSCVFHQKMIARAIKKARHMALLPFIAPGGVAVPTAA